MLIQCELRHEIVVAWGSPNIDEIGWAVNCALRANIDIST